MVTSIPAGSIVFRLLGGSGADHVPLMASLKRMTRMCRDDVYTLAW